MSWQGGGRIKVRADDGNGVIGYMIVDSDDNEVIRIMLEDSVDQANRKLIIIDPTNQQYIRIMSNEIRIDSRNASGDQGRIVLYIGSNKYIVLDDINIRLVNGDSQVILYGTTVSIRGQHGTLNIT
jgi:hypothetical protein